MSSSLTSFTIKLSSANDGTVRYEGTKVEVLTLTSHMLLGTTYQYKIYQAAYR